MAEQHVQGRPPPIRLSQSPSESDPTALPSPSTIIDTVNMYADGHGVPAVDLNFHRPQASQEHTSPNQRLPSMDPRGASPSLHHGQPFGAASTRNPASARHFSSQGEPHPHQASHTHASTDYPSARLASSVLHQSEYHSSFAQAEPDMQTHAPEIAHDNQSSSHGSPAQHPGAPTDRHLPNPDLPSDENNGLKFDSFDHAKAERAKVFVRKLKGIAVDDVEEVDQHRGKYVLAVERALRRKDFLPPPECRNDTKKDDDGNTIKLDEHEVAEWKKWQKKGQEDFRVHLTALELRAGSDWDEIQFRAYEVVNGIIEIHRKGYQSTKKNQSIQQKADEPLKCSARIEEAIRVITGYARVRVKIFDGDNIPEFCISPAAYAKVTIAAHWNNSNRPQRAGNPADGKKKKVENERSTKKRKNKKSGVGAAGTGNGIEQELTSAVSDENRANGSSPVDADGEGEDEDADGEIDDDPITEAIINNTLPASNNGGFGENRFGDVPGHPPMRRFPHVDNTHSAYFGENSATTGHSRQFYQATTRGLTTQAFAMQTASAAMLPASDPWNPMTTGAVHPSQHNMYSPRLLPAPVRHLDNNFDYTPTAYMHSSAGFSNPQAPQSDVGEAHITKRRKLGN